MAEENKIRQRKPQYDWSWVSEIGSLQETIQDPDEPILMPRAYKPVVDPTPQGTISAYRGEPLAKVTGTFLTPDLLNVADSKVDVLDYYGRQFIEPSKKAAGNIENMNDNWVANLIGLPTNIAHQAFAPFSTSFSILTDAVKEIPSVDLGGGISVGGKELANAVNLPFEILANAPGEGAKLIDKSGFTLTNKELAKTLGVNEKTLDEITASVTDVNALAITLIGLKLGHSLSAKLGRRGKPKEITVEESRALGEKAMRAIRGEDFKGKLGQKLAPQLARFFKPIVKEVKEGQLKEDNLTKEGKQYFRERLNDKALTENEREITLNYLKSQGLSYKDLNMPEPIVPIGKPKELGIKQYPISKITDNNRAAIEGMLSEGKLPRDIANALGVKATDVAKIRTQIKRTKALPDYKAELPQTAEIIKKQLVELPKKGKPLGNRDILKELNRIKKAYKATGEISDIQLAKLAERAEDKLTIKRIETFYNKLLAGREPTSKSNIPTIIPEKPLFAEERIQGLIKPIETAPVEGLTQEKLPFDLRKEIKIENLEETNKQIREEKLNPRIRDNELNKYLQDKFENTNYDEFNNALDKVREEVYLTETQKNDFQATKRRIVFRNWQSANNKRKDVSPQKPTVTFEDKAKELKERIFEEIDYHKNLAKSPSDKASTTRNIKKIVRELRGLGVDATFQDNKLFIDKKRVTKPREKVEQVKLEDVEVTRPEAIKSFKELGEIEKTKQQELSNFVEADMLPKGIGKAKLEKGIADIKKDDGLEQSPEAKIVRDAAKNIEAKGFTDRTSGQEVSAEEVQGILDERIKDKVGEEIESLRAKNKDLVKRSKSLQREDPNKETLQREIASNIKKIRELGKSDVVKESEIKYLKGNEKQKSEISATKRDVGNEGAKKRDDSQIPTKEEESLKNNLFSVLGSNPDKGLVGSLGKTYYGKEYNYDLKKLDESYLASDKKALPYKDLISARIPKTPPKQDKLYQENMFDEVTPQRKTTDELYTPPDAEGAKSRKAQELSKLKATKRNYDLAIENTKDSNKLIKLKEERGKITRKISEIEDAQGKNDLYDKDSQDQTSLFQKKNKPLSVLSRKELDAEIAKVNKLLPEGFKVKRDPNLVDENGKPARASVDLVNKEITVNPNLADQTSIPHEIGHGALSIVGGRKADFLLKQNGWDGKGEASANYDNESWKKAHEDVADKFVDWETNKEEFKKSAGRLYKIYNEVFTKLKQLLESLRNWFKGKGFTSEAKFYDDLSKGKFRNDNKTFGFAEPQFVMQKLKDAFYSKVEKLVSEKAPNKNITKEQLMPMLEKNGAKKAELEWLDIEGFLEENPKATKAELLDYIKANEIKIEEVERGGKSTARKEYLERRLSELDSDISNWEEIGLTKSEKKSAEKEYDELSKEYDEKSKMVGRTKFSQHTLPGGENYRELLFTLPERNEIYKDTEGWTAKRIDATKSKARLLGGAEKMTIVWSVRDAKGNVVDTIVEYGEPRTEISVINEAFRNKKNTEIKDQNFKSSHWSEPNVFAHARMNDRVVNDKKYLHAEEIQSDWARRARKEGLSNPELSKKLKNEFNDIVEKIEDHNSNIGKLQNEYDSLYSKTNGKRKREIREQMLKSARETSVLYEMRNSLVEEMDKVNVGVPDFPFKNNWAEVTLKSLLRKAAEEGYDGISWVTGEQTAARYDLSKKVDEIKSFNTPNNPTQKYVAISLLDDKYTHSLQVNLTSGIVEQSLTKEFVDKKLEDIVGKETSKKLLEADPNDKGIILKGDDLKVGGKWAENLYDKEIPNFLNKYGKKWGAKVEDIEISTNEEIYVLYNKTTGHSIGGGYTLENAKKQIEENPNWEYKKESSGDINVHSLPITEEMKHSVLTVGQPLFQKGADLFGETLGSSYEKLEDKWLGSKDLMKFKAGIEREKLQEEIKTTDKKNYQDIDEAIHVYLDLKRDPEKISIYDKLNARQKRILDRAQNLTRAQKVIAEKIRREYDRLGKIAQEEDIIKNTLDNYVNRVWNIPKKAPHEAFRKFGTSTRHARQRVFETILDGWEKGYELNVAAATDNLAILKQELINAIENKNLIKQGMALKDSDGNALFTTQHLDGYKLVEHPNFTTWKWRGKVKPGEKAPKGKNFYIAESGVVLEKASLYAPEKIAKRLNNILGVSKLNEIPGIKAITAFNATVKATILQSNLFHHQAFARSYLFGGAVSLKDVNLRKAYKKGLESAKSLSPDVEILVRNGLTMFRNQDYGSAIETQKTKLGKILDGYKVTSIVKDKILRFQQRQADYLFKKYGAGLKMQAALLEHAQMLKKYPEMPANERAKIVANLVNDDFGGLNLERMGRNRTTQHVFRLLALAPDWTESNVRSMVKAFKKGEEGKVYRTFWKRVAARGLGLTVALNFVLAAFDDTSEGDDIVEKFANRYKRAWEKGNLRWLEVDITPIYQAVSGDKDNISYFSLLGHFKDPVKFVLNPIRSMNHKGSPIFKMGYEALTGENWKGRRFTTFDELIGEDNKGTYITDSKKYGYKSGDPKGGKNMGELTAFDIRGGHAIDYTQLPSYVTSQIRNMMPIQAQNLTQYLLGEQEGFEALAKGLGINATVTKNENYLSTRVYELLEKSEGDLLDREEAREFRKIRREALSKKLITQEQSESLQTRFNNNQKSLRRSTK